MSVLDISEKIGLELQNTIEGKDMLATMNCIRQEPKAVTDLLYDLINQYYFQMHFFSVAQAVNLIELNVNNEVLGKNCKQILDIADLKSFQKKNSFVGEYVDRIINQAFCGQVRYELPKEIHSTPKLVRLSNALTVQCLRTDLIRRLIEENAKQPKAVEEIGKRFDELRGRRPIIPYQKEDRCILQRIRQEYRETDIANILYDILALQVYIKSMIFDAFYGNVFEIKHDTRLKLRRDLRVGKAHYVKIIMDPVIPTMSSSSGWILKLHDSYGGCQYGQITKKQIRFCDNSEVVYALIFDKL